MHDQRAAAQIFQGLQGRPVAAAYQLLADGIVSAGKGDAAFAALRRDGKRGGDQIPAPLLQPVDHIDLRRRHHHFQAQLVQVGKFFYQIVFETHQLAAPEKIVGGRVAGDHAQCFALLDDRQIVVGDALPLAQGECLGDKQIQLQ